jgi:hypothetical protein
LKPQGNIGDPELVGPRRRKSLIQKVFCHCKVVPGIGGGLGFAFLHAAQAQFMPLAHNAITLGFKALRS